MPDLSFFNAIPTAQRSIVLFASFNCLARYAVGINHRRSHISMAQYRLDRTNRVICLQKMRSKQSVETHKIGGSDLESCVLLTQGSINTLVEIYFLIFLKSATVQLQIEDVLWQASVSGEFQRLRPFLTVYWPIKSE
jgi:hypothetical protein